VRSRSGEGSTGGKSVSGVNIAPIEAVNLMSDRNERASEIRDLVMKFDDPQIKEVLVAVQREQGPEIVYANLSKFSRLGVDFVLDLVQIDPAELHILVQAARVEPEKRSALTIRGKVVGRVLMGPIMVANVRDQAAQILEGVRVEQPKKSEISGEAVTSQEPAAAKKVAS
jgi:hypothetical protein